MAAPSYATDLNDIYTDTDNFSAVGGGRVTATETDDYIQGSNCWSHDPFSSGIEGGAYDTVSGLTITSGSVVFIWTKCDVAATLATHSAGGIQAIIGNSTTAYDAWYVAGSDDYVYGGWKCYPVDPTKTVSTTVGTPNGTLDHFGVRWNVPSTGASKGYPMKIDAIRHGSNIEITAGEVANPATWDTTAAHDSTNTRQWGLVQPTDAGAEIQGDIFWGTAAASVYSRDSNRAITIIDTEFTDTDFTQIIFAHASNDIVWDNVGVVALGTNNRGIIDVTANGTIEWTNSVFQDIDVTNLDTGCTFDGSKWISTNEVDGAGASMVGCKILTPTVAADSYGLLWNVATDPDGLLDNMEFSKGTASHHAIEFGTSAPTTMTLTGVDFSGFSGTTTAATLNFLRTTGTTTVNLVGCTGTVTAQVTGTHTVEFVIDPVTTLVNIKDETGANEAGVSVYLEAADATGDLPFEQSITSITRSTTTATVTFAAAHGLQAGEYLKLGGITDKTEDLSGAFEVLTVPSTTTLTYTTTDSGSTNYTGTIIGTGATIYGTTDASGNISSSRTYSNPQPLIGYARKGSGTPFYYKTIPLEDTVSITTGLTINRRLIKDE